MPLAGASGRRLHDLFKRLLGERPKRHLRLIFRRGTRERVLWLRFGSFRRLTPFTTNFGYDRGRPVDRYYIEQFLAKHAPDVRGNVLEIGDKSYTVRYGGGKVSTSDVLHVRAGHPGATIVASLESADHIRSEQYDCVILTQTLHLVFHVDRALRTVHRILKPGGVILATFPGITPIDRGEWRDSWYWSFTTLSARRIFSAVFREGEVLVASNGNMLAAITFLSGLASEDLRPDELEYVDPAYELLITVRAVKRH